ncbi:UNVERIFIED_CONTAM: hypothetical protein PYX00_004983 [Menopon gallinae]|uniref:Uncharacterized protein n=1 Tax=Menopon gallinae TaxID=328185 RepID=A0AAW2I7K2_9NEOP
MGLIWKAMVFLFLANVSSGVANTGSLFSELFKTITNALIASGANGPPRQQIYPSESNGISSSVYSALQTIVKNDDLQCVPRLLCEAVAGGNPGGSRQINIDKYSLSKLISYLQLDPTNSSPMLAFGRAVVLGLSNRGDPYSCIVNYPKCPKDETRLLYYLNNHRGGFFRFFDMKLPHQNYQYGQNTYYSQYTNTYKPNRYYYSRRPDNYPFKTKEKSSETYAKKYGHSITFPVRNSPSDRVIFPSEALSEPRIQTKIVPPDYKYGDNGFVFSNSQRYGKEAKGFFPLNAVTRPTHLVTDRLPSKFYFPENDDDHHSKYSDLSGKGLIFPRD